MMETQRKTFHDANGRAITVTAWTLHGSAPGPVMTVIAGQHGMEHSGPCLLPEFAQEMDASEFRGTLHIIPCANPPALEMDYEFYPEREDLSRIKDYYYSRFRHNYCPWNLGRDSTVTLYNMNRLWNRPDMPGLAGEITRWLWSEFCGRSNLIIDLHCLQARKPVVYNSFAKNLRFAAALGAERIAMCDPNPDENARGNLSWQGSLGRNSYAVCLEFSVQHALGEHEYEFGKQALRNVMCAARMTDGEVKITHPVWKTDFGTPENTQILKVSHTGHIRYLKELNDVVHTGDRLFELRDIQTLEVLEEGRAERDGIMTGIAYQPVTAPGLTVCFVSEAELLAEPGRKFAKMEEGWHLS